MQKIDFWKKAFAVLIGIFIFRIGSHIPVPSIDPHALSLYVAQLEGTLIEIMNTFSGGSIKRFSILAVGIMPYISASIIIQMFSFFQPSLKQLKQEGEKGQLKLSTYTRYLTLVIAFIQSVGITNFIAMQNVNGISLVSNPDIGFFVVSVLSLTTGSLFLLFLGEKMTEHGVGSGISAIIFAGIISGMPATISSVSQLISNGEINKLLMVVLGILFFTIIYVIILVESSQRRISLINSGTYEQSSYLPLKVNMAGIMPAIFASTLLIIPFTINGFLQSIIGIDLIMEFKSIFGESHFLYIITFSLMILFFTFFYTNIIFNPKETADNLQNSGSFLRGIRPGLATEVYLRKVVKRLALIGGVYMVIICLLPEILVSYFSVPFYLGGTSLLIMVLVSKEWMEQYNMSRHSDNYKSVKNNLMGNFKDA